MKEQEADKKVEIVSGSKEETDTIFPQYPSQEKQMNAGNKIIQT
jgi:hypothetical protein